MNDLFLEILNQTLSEELYGASVAEIEYYLQNSNEGFIIKLFGFNHKLDIVLSTILDFIVQFPFEDEMFESIKTFLMKSYFNFIIKPGKLIKDIGSSLVSKVYYTKMERLAELPKVSKEMLRDYVKKCFETAFVEGLFQGNLKKQEVLAMVSLVKQKLGLKALLPENFPKIKILKINKGSAHCCVKSFNKEDDNSIITNYYQIGSENLRDSCLLQMLIHYMWEPCFNYLRTNEQLGYIVGCQLKAYFGVMGFVIFSQTPSSKFNSRHVDERMETFLAQYLKTSSEIDEEAFSTKLYSYIQLKKTEDLTLQSEVDRNWLEIVKHRYMFDRREQEVALLEKLTAEDLRKFASLLLHACDRRKLSLQVVGPSDNCTVLRESTDMDVSNEHDVCDSPQILSLRYMNFISNAGEHQSSLQINDILEFKQTLDVYPDDTRRSIT